MDWMDWTIVLLACATGAGAGRIGRWALQRACPPVGLPAGTCEIGTAALWTAVAVLAPVAHWPGWWLPLPLVLGAFAVPLALADLRCRRLPDTLTLPAYPALGIAVATAALAAPSSGLLVRAGVSALLFGLTHALVRMVTPAALGAGDVKLAGSLGAVLGASGWAALPIAACGAALCSLLLAAAAALTRRGSWRPGVPHGPGLLAATMLLVLFAGGR